MIDEKKVKLMTRMASYENNEGREDLRISAYYRKDYTSFHTLCSIIWVTIGYGCLVLLVGACFFDQLADSMSMGLLVTTGFMVIIGYLAIVVIYAVAAHRIFRKRHQRARARVKRYNHDLVRLLKLYKKESK